MISAFSSSHRLVLGQRKVADKSNEITAIPELLDLLTVKGAIVTIDAMGCQKEIAKKIVEKEADYVLALKGNQGTLSADVELFFTEQKACKFRDTVISRHETLEKSHGRIETRTFTSTSHIDWLKERHDWVGLKSIVVHAQHGSALTSKASAKSSAEKPKARRAITYRRSPPTLSARATPSAATGRSRATTG